MTPPSPLTEPGRILLESAGITFGYGRRPVLRGVSVSGRAGEVVALLGPNGCGKSTLLKVLLGQLKGAGTVRWAKDTQPAFLPQHPTYIPGMTVWESILMGRYRQLGLLGVESRRDAHAARDAAETMGLQLELDRPMDELSGGQRQRVFLARCLAQEPGALLLDEPDTFLDLAHAVSLAKRLKALAGTGRMLVLLASHDLHLAGAIADRVVLMHDGAVLAEGPPRTVLTQERIAQAYGVGATVWEQAGSWGVAVKYE